MSLNCPFCGAEIKDSHRCQDSELDSRICNKVMGMTNADARIERHFWEPLFNEFKDKDETSIPEKGVYKK